MNSGDLKDLQTFYKIGKIHLKKTQEYIKMMIDIVGGDEELKSYLEDCAADDIHFLEIEDRLLKIAKENGKSGRSCRNS